MSFEAVVSERMDYPWKTAINPILGDLALAYNRGNIVDVGCGTCQLYVYLKERGWTGTYIGIDHQRYEGYSYPEGATLLIANALTVELPFSDTYILYDVLEHVDDPVSLLSRCLRVARNVLVAIPKRNEDLWRYGIVEYHQLDRTHKHHGFSRDEVETLVRQSDGQIVRFQEVVPTDLLTVLPAFSESRWLHRWVRKLLRIWPSKVYYQEFWCEVEPAAKGHCL
jgi:SAM-dependent methyltransferase